nr:replication initiation protein [Novosphingobium sp. SG707]
MQLDIAGDYGVEDNGAAVTARAMRVAATLARKGGDEFAKPGKLVEVRFVKGQSLSLTASRLLALMILTAGGDAWRDTSHKLRKADIRRGHKGNERIVDMLEELHRTLFAEDDTSWRGRKATKRFSLIESSWEEVEEGDKETGWIEWRFTPDARRLIQESQTYSVMNRQAVLGFRSAYALKLYEEGALRLHRRQPIWRVDILGLRAALGIDPDKYGDFAQLRRKVLTVAQSEIDQLAHYNLEWKEIRRGRAVAEIEFRFVPKDAPAQIQTVDELERHSAGRKARREGEVERIAAPVAATVRTKRTIAAPATPWEKFPEGSLRYGTAEGAFRDVALRYGGGWDMDLIADAYRQQMGDRLGSLRGAKLEKSWRGFCEAFLARRGRP